MPKTTEEIINELAGDTPDELENEPVSDPEDESEDDSEATAEDDSEEDEESADDEDEDEEEDASDEEEEEPGDSPLIDVKVKEALKDNPEALKILERQEKGFRKAIERNRELQPLAEIDQLLRNPQTVGETIKFVLERNAAAYGVSVQELLDHAYQGTEMEPDPKSEIEQLRQEMARLREETQKQAQATEEAQYVEKIAPKVIRQAKVELNGFGVTTKMISAAIREYPQHRNEPLRAIKAKYADQIIKHSSSVPKGLKAAGHKLPDSTRAKGERVNPGSVKDASLSRLIDNIADAF